MALSWENRAISVEEYFNDTEIPQVQLYRREDTYSWKMVAFSYEDEVELTSLGMRFPVVALYKKTRLAR